MRIMLKGADGKWSTEAAPEGAAELLNWLYKQDGEDAVVADDQEEVYYCANEATLQLYRSKGKSAEMFSVLAPRLRMSPTGTD